MFTGLKNKVLGHKRDPALNNKGAPVPRLFAEKHLADRHFADSTFDRRNNDPVIRSSLFRHTVDEMSFGKNVFGKNAWRLTMHPHHKKP